MFQSIVKSLGRFNSVLVTKVPSLNTIPGFSSSIQGNNFHSLAKRVFNIVPAASSQTINSSSLLNQSQNVLVDQVRSSSNATVIKYSIDKGIRLSEPEVIKIFYRLDWGMWIRTKCGRHKKMFKKSNKQKLRLKQHVMCNAKQCTLLDKMVNNTFKRKRYFVDDPYEPYHLREEFNMTRRKPRPLPELAYSIVDTSP